MSKMFQIISVKSEYTFLVHLHIFINTDKTDFHP